MTTKLEQELERLIAFHHQQWRRYRDALAVLRGRGEKKRNFSLRPGSLPARVADLLRRTSPLTIAQIVSQLRVAGMSTSVRGVSMALSRYIRNGRTFGRDVDGRYVLLEE